MEVFGLFDFGDCKRPKGYSLSSSDRSHNRDFFASFGTKERTNKYKI